MRQALEDGSYLCVESTSNQVNQLGGYTGLTAVQFATFIYSLAQKVGLEKHRILLGGDHLGPSPWRHLHSQKAMDRACELVRDCVLAGYTKIHLDASMACADDPVGPLDECVVARRAALLCQTAESARVELGTDFGALLYVIGTEVPTPGGEQSNGPAPLVTEVADVQQTLEIARRSFLECGLEDAWQRVIGLVVQPGVEFGDATVFDYDRVKAQFLSQHLPTSPALVYEAHSTDYQLASALRRMVEDHFAILKVGPWLTFSFREAVFALSEIEREWLGARRSVQLSRVRDALERAMLSNPSHWKAYYSGDDAELQFARRFSFSDRCRYYWPDGLVQRELKQLLTNLGTASIPLTLLSQFMPMQYERVRAGRIPASCDSLIDDNIRRILKMYAAACGSNNGSVDGASQGEMRITSGH
jgi:D-tagatose-1,6-bisphosphate aldolase subunit GatZ/KbaZ